MIDNKNKKKKDKEIKERGVDSESQKERKEDFGNEKKEHVQDIVGHKDDKDQDYGFKEDDKNTKTSSNNKEDEGNNRQKKIKDELKDNRDGSKDDDFKTRAVESTKRTNLQPIKEVMEPVTSDKLVEQHEKVLGINLNLAEKHFLLSSKDCKDLFNGITISDGAFGILLEQVLSGYSREYPINHINSPTSNFTCVGLNKQIREVDTGDNQFIGCNKRFIDDSGNLMTNELIYDITRNSPDKFFTPTDISEKVCRFSLCDSHTAFIYNMLTTWLYTFIFESGSSKQTAVVDHNFSMIIKLIKPYYEDSHCKIFYNLQDGESDNIEVVVPYYYFNPNSNNRRTTFSNRIKTNFFDLQDVILLPNNKHPQQINFYLSHTQNRNPYNEQVNFDIGFKTDKTHFVVDFVGIKNDKFISDVNLILDPCRHAIPSHTMLLWIIEYAQVNRLYYDFSLALELLFRAAFWPIPESQEGMIWPQQGVMVIGMPSFSPLRACFPNLIQGEAFMKEGVYQINVDQPKIVKSQLALAALENYAMIYALQLQIYVRTHRCRTWYAATRAVDSYRYLTEGWDIYQVLFSQTYKCIMLTNMSVNGFVTFCFSYMNAERVYHVRPKEERLSRYSLIAGDRTNMFTRDMNLRDKKKYNTKLNAPLPYEPFVMLITSDVLANELLKYFSQEEIDKTLEYTTKEEMDEFYNTYLTRFNNINQKDSFFVSTLPTWVSGAMLDGSVSTSSVYTTCIEPLLELQPVGNWETKETRFDTESALKITQLFRYFNRDCFWGHFDSITPCKHTFVPWGGVHQRIIEPCSLIYRSQHGYYALYNVVLAPHRMKEKFNKPFWTVVSDGFKLHKGQGKYSCIIYKKRKQIRSEYNYIPSQLSAELTLVSAFRALPGRVNNVLGYNAREVEELSAASNFQSPGLPNEDPASMEAREQRD